MPLLRQTLLFLLIAGLSAVMLSAAWWQFGRGQQKAAQAEQRARAEALAPVDLDPGLAWGQRVRVQGRFVPGQQVLLDNQVRNGRVGVHVWTPVELASGALVLVDRGWIAAPADRQQVPQWDTPDTPVDLSGHWTRLPRPGLRVDGEGCAPGPWPRRLVYPSLEDLRCLYDAPLAHGLVQLSPEAPHGFARDWTVAGLSPERHHGYAVQWLALTLALWTLTWIAWRRRERSPLKR